MAGFGRLVSSPSNCGVGLCETMLSSGFFAKPIVLSAMSLHFDAIVSKYGDASSEVADSIAPRSWVWYAFLMDGT